jgi:endonuclease/exonuclease/phosphatase family metal-dependent hydrolase
MICSILTYNTHGLPWSKDCSKEVCSWIKEIKPQFICLQEVFRKDIRQYYYDHLTREGYTVCIPKDGDFSFMSSGLITASLDRDFTFLSDCFCSHQTYHNVEILANKGFHILRVIDKRTHSKLTIVNTHTQADTEVSWIFGKSKIDSIRIAQIEQIVAYFENDLVPALVVGDLNCEHSPHPHLRFLSPYSPYLLRKSTFYSSGEDLDHIGWLPLQWANPNCAWCDIVRNGPQLKSIRVFHKPWSDHAPVFATVYIPKNPKGLSK